MRLIIIGNGFDLAHGLKTSFSDFKKFLKEQKDEDSNNLIKSVDEVLMSNNHSINDDYEWNNIENIIYEEFNRDKTQSGHDKLENLIENISISFSEYLKSEILPKCDDIKKNENISKYFNDEFVILNFNYTNLYNKYTDKGGDFVFNIHGNIEKESEDILIGYYMSDSNFGGHDYRMRYRGKEICKTAERYKYSEKDLVKEKTSFINSFRNKIDDIVIFGYSFGDSDAHIYEILRNILTGIANNEYISKSEFLKLRKIKLTIFDYNGDATTKKEKLLGELKKKSYFFDVKVSGYGYKPLLKELIEYNTEKYN